MAIGFRSKVLLAISGVTVCACIGVAVVYLQFAQANVEQNYVSALWKSMSVSASSFDENMRDAYNALVELRYDQRITNLLLDGPIDAADARQISAFLQEYESSIDNAKEIYYYLPSENQVVTSKEYHSWMKLDEKTSWFQDINWNGLSPQLLWNDIHTASPEYIISYCGPLMKDDKLQAVICINLDERRLFYQYLDEIGANREERFYLLDSNGIILSTAAMNEIGKPFAQVYGCQEALLPSGKRAGAFVLDGARLIAVVEAPLSGCLLVSVSDQRELTNSLHQQTFYLITLSGLIFIVLLIPAYHMAGRVYAPVKKLKDAMQEVSQGNLSIRAAVYSQDEIGQLACGFNDMIEQIEGLIRDLVAEQMQKKEAELEALQYQITPHFMYNTLNSIKYAAILQGNAQVGEQLGAFIALLQASISRGGAFITVKDEMRMVENYVKLQQFRYQDNFQVRYDISQAAQGCYVPRLLLQPLVENAILHGRNSKTGKCEILVSAVLVMDTVVMSVQDSGDGMMREKIAALLQGKSKSHFSGIGIPNIIERLRLYYGDRASLQYTSSEHGTKAVILLPATTSPDTYII